MLGGFMKFSTIVKLLLLLVLAIIGARGVGYLHLYFGVTNKWVGFFLSGVVMALVNQVYDIVVKVVFSKKYSENLKRLYRSSGLLTKKESDELKRKTVVELYLIKEKKIFIKAKISTLLILIATTIIHIQYSIGVFIIGWSVILFLVLEVKDRIITYRISRGFFGSNRYEALQLINFINENIDDINGGSNGGRKILNDRDESYADLAEVKKGAWENLHG
ncbi:hypothetical protein DPU05_19600 [Salmonella enterica subsp. enterica serovar Teddington]|nr:hypothetical protein [Salmonella enterica subsp. enterica serovar Teddington]KSB23271.1 hypothetical protein LFZ91_12705 [Salmonella enterica subsp. enterica serovar Hillingdon]